jgi:hypothetical protein
MDENGVSFFTLLIDCQTGLRILRLKNCRGLTEDHVAKLKGAVLEVC